MKRKVAALCVSRRSIYHRIPGVDAFDLARDARTFAGGIPVVAHPPCRGWSLRLRHCAKPVEGERELGVWCCDVLRREGGILEQPAGSLLFAAGGLPQPGCRIGELYTIEVCQWWWGFPSLKPTWLCLSGIEPAVVECPLRMFAPGRMGNVARMSKAQRSETVPELALWLVDLARRVERSRNYSTCSDEN